MSLRLRPGAPLSRSRYFLKAFISGGAGNFRLPSISRSPRALLARPSSTLAFSSHAAVSLSLLRSQIITIALLKTAHDETSLKSVTFRFIRTI
jgi:hypothetical protein